MSGSRTKKLRKLFFVLAGNSPSKHEFRVFKRMYKTGELLNLTK